MTETHAPLFSIITACFNSEKYIDTVFRSLASQTFRNFEHIVIDGGSTDETLSMIELNKNTISYWISEADKGLYHAINKGFFKASGTWVGILHSDDFLANPSTLGDIAHILTSETPDLLYADLIYVDSKSPEHVLRTWKAGIYQPQSLYFGWMPPHPTVFVRRELFVALQGFDTQFRISADYDFMIRALQQSQKVSYLPRVTTYMRAGGLSNNSWSNVLQKSYEDLRIIHKNRLASVVTLLCKNVRKLPQLWRR